MKKKQTWGIGILLGCLLLPCGALVRATDETLILIAEENKVKAELSPPDNADIVSLQLAFQIDMSAEDAGKGQVSFEFDSGIVSGVKQYRYRQDTGILTVYISGKEALFASDKLNDGDALTLGTVVLESDVTADVHVKEGSLVTMVNDAFDMQQQALISSGAHVVATGNGSGQPNEDDGEEWGPVEDVVNPGEVEENPDEGNGDSGYVPENPDGVEKGPDNVWHPDHPDGVITRPEDTRPEGGWNGYRPVPEHTTPVASGTEAESDTPVTRPSTVPSGNRGILSAYKQSNGNRGTAGTAVSREEAETIQSRPETGEQNIAAEEEESGPQDTAPNRGQMILRVEKPSRPKIGTIAKVLLGAGFSALLVLGAGMVLIVVSDHKKKMRRMQRLHNKRRHQ